MKKKNPYNLTDKQYRFCKEYMIDLNATQAAIRSGYSKKTANEQGCQNLVKLNIQEYIAELRKKTSDKLEVKSEDILRQLDILRKARIDEYTEFYSKNVLIDTDKDGNNVYETIQVLRFKTFDKLSEDQLKAIESIKEGKYGIELKLHGKDWTIEKINRHIGFYEVDNDQKKPEVNINMNELSFEELKEIRKKE